MAEHDPLRRQNKKAAAPSEAPRNDDDDAEELAALDADKKPKKKDRLDYSRFTGIGEDTKDERIQTGDVVWDDLNMKEKKEIFDQEEQVETIIARKRQEEEDFKKHLREKPSDFSWVGDRHFATKEAFMVGRVEATFKKAGNDAFKNGNCEEATRSWYTGIDVILSLGDVPPEGWTMIGVLRNNIAQVMMKQGKWNKVKELTDKILERDATNEKALYRRAQTYIATSIYDKAERDLEVLVKNYPENKEGAKAHKEVRRKLGRDRKKLEGKAVNDIANGLLELTSDGTVRKLKIEEYGDGDPDEPASWFKQNWIEKSEDRVVVTCQMVITSHGGEELYNSREYRPFPETKKARDELKEYMDMVQFLDEEAGKKPRVVGDFYQKVKKKPVRWALGDPGMYKGFDLAVRTMKVQEKALFEVDQPMLNPSVDKYYDKLGFHSGLAGLPQLVYHIEEERLAILEDEVPEQELDLDSKTQRGVKVELQLLGYISYRDISPNLDQSKLHGVIFPGYSNEEPIQQGAQVRGAFFITRPFDGSLLTQNQYVEWRLGIDEGLYEKEGDNREPLRPGGGSFVPKCVADALLSVSSMSLRMGCLVEVRTRVGPELHEICPQLAKQFEQARRENHKKGKRGGAPCSVMVQIYASDTPRPDGNSEGETQQYIDESNIQDMDIE